MLGAPLRPNGYKIAYRFKEVKSRLHLSEIPAKTPQAIGSQPVVLGKGNARAGMLRGLPGKRELRVTVSPKRLIVIDPLKAWIKYAVDGGTVLQMSRASDSFLSKRAAG